MCEYCDYALEDGFDICPWCGKTLSEWISEEDKPIPKDKPIQRWHKLWKCPVSVYWCPELIIGCPWVTVTKSNSWPEEAFTKYWMELPKPPPEE